MEITYLGHSSFLITAEDGTKLVTDPYTGIGYEMPAVEADHVVCSHFHFDHGYTQGVRGYSDVISEPGEYRCGGIKVTGYGSFHDDVKGAKRGRNVIFVMEADGKRICHMGDIGERISDSLAANLKGLDLLMVPIGGVYTIDAKGALELIERLQPNAACAMHFKCKDCMLDIDPATVLEKLTDKCERIGSVIPMEGQSGKIWIPERR